MGYVRCVPTPLKRRFLSALEAAEALEKIMRTPQDPDHYPIAFYECKVEEGGCGGWHLTSHPLNPPGPIPDIPPPLPVNPNAAFTPAA